LRFAAAVPHGDTPGKASIAIFIAHPADEVAGGLRPHRHCIRHRPQCRYIGRIEQA
jgi:hypothetical protein